MSEYKLTHGATVIRVHDAANIPFDPDNIDYIAFLQWQAAGGVPDPIDPPDPKQLILDQIIALESTITSRRIRESGADSAGGTTSGRVWMKNVNDQINELRQLYIV